MTTACPRLFEAEAMRDGRLTGAERASFERHLATCPACEREVEALEALAGALRASSESVSADELHVRRERTRLVAAFDRALVAPERRIPRWVALAAAGVVLALACIGVWRVRRAPAPAVAAAEVRVQGDTVWSSRMDGDRQRVVLEQGGLWIHVDHTRGAARLVVVLPDGELEDTGTTFAVRADAGRTTRVAVEDGRVVLHLRDRPPVTLGSGETWVADLPAPVACATTPPPPAPALPVHAAPNESAAPRRAPAPPASVAVADDSSAEFRGAMDALDRGDNREAASRLAAFLAAHPRDTRGEDAAYLRVIALQRCGDTAGARDAAREYLGRYPAGFRRVEMEAMSR